jgi:hypothetical protein
MPISFHSADGRFVHLDAVAYEADVKNWLPDSWLMIELDAYDGVSRWRRESSALETADVERLAQFLRNAAEGRALPPWGWGATESDIELTIERRAIENQHRVTVRLNCHFHRDYEGEPCFKEWLELPFLLSDEDLLRIAAGADDIARRFPERPRTRSQR